MPEGVVQIPASPRPLTAHEVGLLIDELVELRDEMLEANAQIIRSSGKGGDA